MSLRWSLASQQILGGGCFRHACYRLSRPVFPFEGRFLRFLLPSVCYFLRAGRTYSSSRYITGTLYIAIDVPFRFVIKISSLRRWKFGIFLYSSTTGPSELLKTVDSYSLLAVCTVMRAASGHDDSPDRGLAAQAWLPRALVDAML